MNLRLRKKVFLQFTSSLNIILRSKNSLSNQKLLRVLPLLSDLALIELWINNTHHVRCMRPGLYSSVVFNELVQGNKKDFVGLHVSKTLNSVTPLQ